MLSRFLLLCALSLKERRRSVVNISCVFAMIMKLSLRTDPLMSFVKVRESLINSHLPLPRNKMEWLNVRL